MTAGFDLNVDLRAFVLQFDQVDEIVVMQQADCLLHHIRLIFTTGNNFAGGSEVLDSTADLSELASLPCIFINILLVFILHFEF